MSLQTDSVFIEAIAADNELMEAIGGELHGTTIAVPDSGLANTPVPFVIVSFDGMRNVKDSKEDGMEGDEDRVSVSIEVAAGSSEELHTITASVRHAVRNYFEENWEDEEVPVDYAMEAGGISYDPARPCYWQVLTYDCLTRNN